MIRQKTDCFNKHLPSLYENSISGRLYYVYIQIWYEIYSYAVFWYW